MKKIFYLLLTTIALLSMTACEREDDIDEIFVGKTWFMNGGTINGKRLNADIKNFFVEGQPLAYSITFNANTFTGMFRNDAPFSGTWSVDGKKHHISLTFKEKPRISNDFEQQIYNVLKAVQSYESGATFLILTEDKNNAVMFGTMR